MGITMSRTVYINGDYLPEADAKIAIKDRDFGIRFGKVVAVDIDRARHGYPHSWMVAG